MLLSLLLDVVSIALMTTHRPISDSFNSATSAESPAIPAAINIAIGGDDDDDDEVESAFVDIVDGTTSNDNIGSLPMEWYDGCCVDDDDPSKTLNNAMDPLSIPHTTVILDVVDDEIIAKLVTIP